MNKERKQGIVFSWTGVLLVAAILAAANILASFLYIRLDLSPGRSYSISSGTKTMLKNLKDTLLIKVYFTPHLPSPYGLNEQYLRDLLGEYKNSARGRVRVEFLNPEANEKIKAEAMSAGVEPIKLSVMTRDKFELKEAFMGLALLYQGKSEVFAFIHNSSDLEYDLTRRIKKLTSPEKKTVAFVTGHAEKGVFDQQLAPIFEPAREMMNIESAALDKPIPASAEALWILGAQQAFKPAELERLKAWVNSGRSLGILLDRRSVDLNSFMSIKINTGLDPLLSAWGVEPKDGFVKDLQCQRIQIQQRQGGFMFMNVIEYPYLPIATDINPKHPATRGLDAVVMPFAHPLTVITGGKPLKYTSLINSTKASWYDTGPAISPFDRVNPKPTQDAKGPFSLAGVIEGEFYKVTPSSDAAQAPGRVILVGTSRLIDPAYAGKSANIAAWMNLLEWSLQDETLLSIRAKGMSFRPLRPLSDAARLAAKNILILFLPAALLAGAGLAYQGQQRRRRRAAAFYQET